MDDEHTDMMKTWRMKRAAIAVAQDFVRGFLHKPTAAQFVSAVFATNPVMHPHTWDVAGFVQEEPIFAGVRLYPYAVTLHCCFPLEDTVTDPLAWECLRLEINDRLHIVNARIHRVPPEPEPPPMPAPLSLTERLHHRWKHLWG